MTIDGLTSSWLSERRHRIRLMIPRIASSPPWTVPQDSTQVEALERSFCPMSFYVILFQCPRTQDQLATYVVHVFESWPSCPSSPAEIGKVHFRHPYFGTWNWLLWSGGRGKIWCEVRLPLKWSWPLRGNYVLFLCGRCDTTNENRLKAWPIGVGVWSGLSWFSFDNRTNLLARHKLA